SLKFLDAANRKDVMRVERAIHERLACPHPVFLLHVYVHAARNRVLTLFTVRRFNDDAAQTLQYGAELHNTVDLGHHGSLARLSRRSGRSDNYQGRQTGHLVHFFASRHAFEQVFEGYSARRLSEDRKRERIPLRELLPLFDSLPIGNLKRSAVIDLIALELTT